MWGRQARWSSSQVAATFRASTGGPHAGDCKGSKQHGRGWVWGVVLVVGVGCGVAVGSWMSMYLYIVVVPVYIYL